MTTVAPFSLGCSNRDSDVKVLLPTLVLPLSLSPPPSHPLPLTPSLSPPPSYPLHSSHHQFFLSLSFLTFFLSSLP